MMDRNASSFAATVRNALSARNDCRCNSMTVKNLCSHGIQLKRYYTHQGKAMKIFSETIEPNQMEDACFKEMYSMFSQRGSGGIITFKLDKRTGLHIMWDCPRGFKKFDNFMALYLCDNKYVQASQNLFFKMKQNVKNAGIEPKLYSCYDLVYCGPWKGTFQLSAGNSSSMNWGHNRPCKVQNGKYDVTMEMGETNNSQCRVTVKRIIS